MDSCRLFPFLYNGEWTGTHIASFCLICALKMPHSPNHTHTFIHLLTFRWMHRGHGIRWTGGNQSTDLLIKQSLSVTKFKYTFTEPTISYKSELKKNNTSVFHIMKKTADCPSARLFRVTLCIKLCQNDHFLCCPIDQTLENKVNGACLVINYYMVLQNKIAVYKGIKLAFCETIKSKSYQ